MKTLLQMNNVTLYVIKVLFNKNYVSMKRIYIAFLLLTIVLNYRGYLRERNTIGIIIAGF